MKPILYWTAQYALILGTYITFSQLVFGFVSETKKPKKVWGKGALNVRHTMAGAAAGAAACAAVLSFDEIMERRAAETALSCSLVPLLLSLSFYLVLLVLSCSPSVSFLFASLSSFFLLVLLSLYFCLLLLLYPSLSFC